uniref:SRCR domain-containing protein n=1 Tax=Sphaeramia orbicularis TaxID=375764 RepID=A0A672Y5W6_9TELE
MKRQDGNWKPVNGLNWYRKLGNRVCAELDCGSAVSVRRRWTGSDIDSWRIRSDCDESALSDCFRFRTSLSSSLELSCSDSVKLVHGSSVCSGRLEVRSNQSRSWSSVCEGHLDLHGAQVVCRELGCGTPGLLQGALYGEAEAPVGQTFQCEGHESVLLDCGSSGSQTCSSGTAVDLTCTGGALIDSSFYQFTHFDLIYLSFVFDQILMMSDWWEEPVAVTVKYRSNIVENGEMWIVIMTVEP